MTPIMVIRWSSVLRRVSQLMCVLTASAVLRAQVNVPVGSSPGAIAVNPMTNKIYIANQDSNNVTVIDGATNATSTVTVGTGPRGVAVNPVTDKIYIANPGSNNVTVIDGATNLTSTVTVGTGPTSVTVNAVTNKIYVINSTSNNVTVIDGVTNAASTLPVGNNPAGVAVNPITDKVYVSNYGFENGNTVTVIDGATNATSTVTVGTGPNGVAVDPVTDKIYVANEGSNNVTVIDGATNATSTVAAGINPWAVAVNPVSNKIYVANHNGSNVTVIDGATSATSTAPTGSNPWAVAVNSVTNKIYVTSFEGQIVTLIDGATNATTTAYQATTSLTGAAINPITNKVYVSNSGGGPFPAGNTVTVLDGAINAVNLVPTGINPANAVAVNPVTNKVYVPNGGSATPGNTVTVFDVATNNVLNTVTVGSIPVWIVVNPVTNKVYVSNIGDSTVSVINSANDAVIGTVTVGSFAFHMAVNPVTNRIYTANAGGNTVSVIDGASDTVIASPIVGIGPQYVAVNSATNKIYVSNSGSATPGNTVSVIDGTTNNIIDTVTVGSNPGWVSANPVTNRIYVANTGIYNTAPGTTVSVIDGTNDTVIATPTTGTYPREMAVNTATNRIYVSNSASNNVTFIDGATNNSINIDTSAVGTYPYGVDVNPVTNSVYVTNNIARAPSPDVVVIDGASNTITATVVPPGIRNPQNVTVYPAANKVYFPDGQSNDVTVIDVDGHQPVPLTTTVSGVVDSLTVSTVNVFQTANRTPSFTVDVASVYNSINPSATNPPPTALYYEVDGGSQLSAGTNTTGSGANPASFSITLNQQQFGLHTLYVYAAYGNEGGHNSNATHTGSSPELGNLTAYLFLIVPIQTTTTVTADVNPQLVGRPVIFTAQIAPPAPVGVPDPTGAVTFYEGTTVLGTGSVNNSGQATFTTSSLSLGSHTITAAYSGDANYSASTSSSLTVSIESTLLTTLELMGGDDQASVYGTAFAQPLIVVLTHSNGTPVGGATVTFAGAGLSFSSGGVVTTNGSGQASVTAIGTHAGILLATATTSGVSETAYFALTVTPAPLIVTANNASRVYGAANPAFTGTVTGAVFSDTFTFSASTIALTSSPVGTYPITPSVTGAALSNYTVHSVDGTLTVTPAPLTVTANNASRIFGQPNPSLSATIAGFVNGETSNVVSGAPSLTTTATQTSPVGTFPITATRGTLAATNYGFVFVNGTLTVTTEAGSVTLTVLPNPVATDDQVMLTATVPTGATGIVTFYDGSTVLGTATIVGTTATLVISTLPVGSHTITAVYSGDTNFTAATSTAVILVVTPDFAVSSKTPSQEIPPGASASFDISIPSVSAAFTNVVTLSASGLPAGASYTFNPATVTPGSAGATSIFTVSLPQQSAMHRNMRMPLVLAVLLLPFAAVKRVRPKPSRLLLWLLLTLTSFAVIGGCGTGGYFSQSQRTYTITITGTSGSLVRTTTVILTIE